jgi:hypothetical protein
MNGGYRIPVIFSQTMASYRKLPSFADAESGGAYNQPFNPVHVFLEGTL